MELTRLAATDGMIFTTLDITNDVNGVIGPCPTSVLTPFPYYMYYATSGNPITTQLYYNNPSLDAVQLNITLTGDANAWGNTNSYYDVHLPTSNTTTLLYVSGGVKDGDLLDTSSYAPFGFTITNHELLSNVYYDPGQFPATAPGVGVKSLPGVATFDGYYGYTQTEIFGRPVGLEVEYVPNPSKTGPACFSGYTNLGDQRGLGVPYLSTTANTGYVARYVAGFVKKTANAATLTESDIIIGGIITGNTTAASANICINGNVVSSLSSTPRIEITDAFDIDIETAGSLATANLVNTPQPWQYITTSIGASSTTVYSNDPGIDEALDVFDIKYVWYLDAVADSGPDTWLGNVGFYMPEMYTSPGVYTCSTTGPVVVATLSWAPGDDANMTANISNTYTSYDGQGVDEFTYTLGPYPYYLTYTGDTFALSGNSEAVGINFNAFVTNNPGFTNISIDLFATWGTGSGNANLNVSVYSGGMAYANGGDWGNGYTSFDNILVYNGSLVNSTIYEVTPGSSIGTINYNIPSGQVTYIP